MQFSKKINQYLLSILIIFTPFVVFIKNNIYEIDIILGKSFIFLIFLLFFTIILFSLLIKFFFKRIKFNEILLINSLIFWIFFQHNILKLFIKNFIFNENLFINLISSELSLIILVIISASCIFLLIKKNFFFIRFLFIFFSLFFVFNLFNLLLNFDYNKNDKAKDFNHILFEDKLNQKKENIYFFILDAMKPIDEFEKFYSKNLEEFIFEVKKKRYNYVYETFNLYDNTTHSLSSLFYLDSIFNDEDKSKKYDLLFPTLLRKKDKSNLLFNLNNLGYDFKWVGNFFAYCPKFNIKYCLNQNSSAFIDDYLYINFFRQSPLIQITMTVGKLINFDFDKYFFFELNNGIGRLYNYLQNKKENLEIPTFYFIHHMSPHWPYLTNDDCSYKKFPGEKNFEGYKSAYLCNLKRIIEIINFLEKYDPNATVIFQSDHNWKLTNNLKNKKSIFNLIKIEKKCNYENYNNLNNVNIMRLVISCMTGNDIKLLKRTN